MWAELFLDWYEIWHWTGLQGLAYHWIELNPISAWVSLEPGLMDDILVTRASRVDLTLCLWTLVSCWYRHKVQDC
jgi:hypothetical protein